MSDKDNRFLVNIRGDITKCKKCQKNLIFCCEWCPECIRKDYCDVSNNNIVMIYEYVVCLCTFIKLSLN